MLKTFASFMLLCAPALAGSQFLASNQSTVTLDAPPPGATQLVVDVSWSYSIPSGTGWCVENLSGSPLAMSATRTQAFTLTDPAASVELLSDRMIIPWSANLGAYDGVTDFTGASAACYGGYSNTKSAGPSTYTFGTAPTTLSFNRRHVVTNNGAVAHLFQAAAPTATVNWTWQ